MTNGPESPENAEERDSTSAAPQSAETTSSDAAPASENSPVSARSSYLPPVVQAPAVQSPAPRPSDGASPANGSASASGGTQGASQSYTPSPSYSPSPTYGTQPSYSSQPTYTSPSAGATATGTSAAGSFGAGASAPGYGAAAGSYGTQPTTEYTLEMPPKTPKEPRSDKRSGRVGILAALAVGAIIGGVAGAGVFAIAGNGSDNAAGTPANNTPANITVNDSGDATSVTGVVATAGPSVVTISVSDDASGSGGTGSGVIITDDGYIVTNTHVVTLDGASADPVVSVQTSDGRLYPATVVGTDPISDLAVVKIDAGDDFQAAEWADSSELNVGDTAIAIGAPLGLANTVTDGIVSSLNRSITVASSAVPDSSDSEAPTPDDGNGDQGPFDFWQFPNDGSQQAPTAPTATIALPVIQTDAAINPGNSGGALLDADGRVIGINVAIASAGSSGSSTSGSIGVGFAIESNLARRIAEEIIQTGTGTHGLLGASVDDVTAATSTSVGALIAEVTDGGAADVAGLAPGDVVTSINGIPVTGKTDLTAQVRALAGGSDATITYLRDGSSNSVDVTLGTLS